MIRPIAETSHLADLTCLPADATVGASQLRARVDLYEDRVLLHTYEAAGLAQTRLVHPEDLAAAFAGWRTVDTGLLGPDTLFVATVGRATCTAVWVPPRVWEAAIMRGGQVTHRLRLPMPGAIALSSSDRRFALFAAKERPGPGRGGLAVELFRFPAFNLHTNHTICTGSHPFSGDPWRLAEEFFASYFATEITGRGCSRRHPHDLLALWEELDGRADYPLDDLVPAGDGGGTFRVRDLLNWVRGGMTHFMPATADEGDMEEDEEFFEEGPGVG